MNKNILIAGGASLASLAAGGATGYLYAKKKLGKSFEERLEREMAEMKKQYSIMLMQAKEKKPSPEELTEQREAQETEEAEETIEKESEPSPEEIHQAKQRSKNGKKALTDYQGISTTVKTEDLETQQDLTGVITKNIFADPPRPKKPQRPPRDEHGKFLPKQEADPIGPFLITEKEFLENDPENDQENCFYFFHQDTVIQLVDRESIDPIWIGPENLKNFPPDDGSGDPRAIYVRNPGLGIDYDITLTEESLTDFLGFIED